MNEPRDKPPCCMPAGSRGAGRIAHLARDQKPRANDRAGMICLEGGPFLMGTDDREGFPADGEGPIREVTLQPFWIDRHAVSSAQFATFVAATGYVTDAERYGWSFVFGGLLPDDFPETRAVAQAPSNGAPARLEQGDSGRLLPVSRLVLQPLPNRCPQFELS